MTHCVKGYFICTDKHGMDFVLNGIRYRNCGRYWNVSHVGRSGNYNTNHVTHFPKILVLLFPFIGEPLS